MELLSILTPLLLVDVLNPVLFAALVFAAGAPRPVANSAALLLGHTLAYAAPFALVPLAVGLMGSRARPLLDRINGWMVRGSDLLMPWMLLAIGLFLLVDVAFYLSTGEPLPLG